MKQIIQEERVSSVEREAGEQNFSRREFADFRIAISLRRFVGEQTDGEKLRRAEQWEIFAKLAFDQHVQRTVEEEFAKSANKRQRNFGNFLFGESGFLPPADVAANDANGRFFCLGSDRVKKIFASLARFGFELEVSEFVAL